MEARQHRLVVLPSAADDLARLPSGPRDRVAARMQLLTSDPRPPGAAKLTNVDGYRIRIGDYRIVYAVDDAARVVVVNRVGHRRDVYRLLR